MNSNDLFNSMGSIDDELLSRAENYKNASGNKSVKKLVSVALCLALAFGAIFGLFKSGTPGTVTPETTDTPAIHNFGIIVASAADRNNVILKKISKEYNIAVPYKCRFLIENVKDLTTEQKKAVFDKLKKINDNNIDEIYQNKSSSYGSEICLSPETENSIYAIYSFDYFTFAVDNAELLDKIVISGTANRNFTKHTADSVIGGAATGKEMIISGNEYRHNNTVGISWTPTTEITTAFENNKDMKISEIKDTLVFTAYFTDGNTKQICLDISFDNNGNMTVVTK